MELSEIVQASKFKITEGSEFLWSCFGNNARNLEFSGFDDLQDSDSGVSCVFDSKNQRVYEVQIYTDDNKWYRWIEPEYLDLFKKECDERKVPFELVGDDTKWIDLDNVDDVFRKIEQVIESGTCDDEVTIELDLDDDLLLDLCLIAHKKNITLNQLMNEVLQNAVNRAEEIIEEQNNKARK